MSKISKESWLLTKALKSLDSDWKPMCNVYTTPFPSENGHLSHLSFGPIPVRDLKPELYTLDRNNKGDCQVHLLCSPLRDIPWLPIYSCSYREHDFMPGGISETRINFYFSVDANHFKELPKPDEFGNYLVSPSGSLVKACRISRSDVYES